MHQTSGAVMLQAARPEGPNQGNYEDHVITVEFRAAANAVNSQLTLTVRHQMLKTIISGAQGMTSRTQCYSGVTQPAGNNQATGGGTQIVVVLPTAEEGTAYSLPNQCDHFVNAENSRTALDPNRAGFRLVRTARDASGLELYPFGGDDYRVRLAGGTPPDLHRREPNSEHCDCQHRRRTGRACGSRIPANGVCGVAGRGEVGGGCCKLPRVRRLPSR